MIDNIKIRYNIDSYTIKNKLVRWLKKNYKDFYKKETNASGLNTYRCQINNIKVFVDTQYVFIYGSLNKFYLGNNIEELDI